MIDSKNIFNNLADTKLDCMTDDVKFNMKKLVTLKRFTTLLDDDSNIEVNYDNYQYYYQYIIFHSLELFSLKSGCLMT